MKNKLNFYGKFFRYILFPFYESILRGRKTLSYLKSAELVLTMRKEDVDELQWKKLKKLLEHAYQNVPYYRETWDSLGLPPEKINSIKDFEKLPILTKDIVNKEYDNLIASNYRGHSKTKSTGGSTGQPFSYEYTYESHKKREAIAMRGYSMAGAGLGVKTWQLWGQDLVHPGWFKSMKNRMFHRFYNRKMANSFAMNVNNLQSYVDDYDRYQPSAIVSYTSPLVQLAEYILDNKLLVHRPDTILTGAEPLYEFQRELIEKAFNAKVHNTYGCREVMLIASECGEQSGLYINSDHLVVEVTDSNEEPVVEKVGKIIISDLSNYAMPLIRYENGDQAILAKETQNKLLPFPILKSIEGRKLDVIKTPDGRLLPGEFFPHLLKDFEGIRKFQIIQNKLDELNIAIVKNESFGKSEEESLLNIIQKHVGREVTIVMSYPDEIALTPSGKFRVTISELKESNGT
jgi:phenylacetate-CoA ligase